MESRISENFPLSGTELTQPLPLNPNGRGDSRIASTVRTDVQHLGKSWISWIGLLFLVGCSIPIRSEQVQVRALRVLSGNTLEVRDLSASGGAKRVRLIGIEAPDLQQKPWGDAAKQQLERLIEGQTLLLEWDIETEDGSDRQLAYLWRDGKLVNEELIAGGYVLAQMRSPNLKYDRRFTQAQEKARIMGQGIWDSQTPLRVHPSDFRQNQP
ncbi:thermonuclease family protein [Oscillatoria acuminata]|uniref:Micrococcal nuclease-like nuclease n=1 Tax=Oscillatoria acuminata PCC 6304 TaxID=56110 RepID=K9TEV0_9CYAN|nr:thermonuclease family protein [Oscillatoria acuminata]AFY81065.1 micrococcal nuclease-like nuclease [Oscillatoria acuminata PCC 6304]